MVRPFMASRFGFGNQEFLGLSTNPDCPIAGLNGVSLAQHIRNGHELVKIVPGCSPPDTASGGVTRRITAARGVRGRSGLPKWECWLMPLLPAVVV